MKIVIDMQGAQAQSRKRGIGRYSLALVQALVREAAAHDVVLLFNALFQEGLSDTLQLFSGLPKPPGIRLWMPPAPIFAADETNNSSRQAAEQLYESVLASEQPDWVLLTSLFEGLSDDSATSIKAWLPEQRVAVVLYDLIPLIRRSPYLDNPAYARWYYDKLEHLKRADLLLAISSSSRDEALSHLNSQPDRVINISSACDAHFKPVQLSAVQIKALRARYRLTKPFVMYTGGGDSRKNLEGLIRAWALLSPVTAKGHQLAIVCQIEPRDQARLHQLATSLGIAAGTLVLTGYVPEQDLVELYNLCHLFVFPAFHEGFGLPVLEAMACGAPAIAANTTSLPEVIGRSEAMFDPHDDQSIADKLQQALTDHDYRARLRHDGLLQSTRFSWKQSARSALAAMEQARAEHAAAPSAAATGLPRLAYVSPLPPGRSGISFYSADLLPALASSYQIDVFVDDSAHAAATAAWNNQSNSYYRILPASSLPQSAHEYHQVLYHFGNSAYHHYMFDLLERVPGIVVLHDFYLSGVVADREGTLGQAGYWQSTLQDSHGYTAVRDRQTEPDSAAVVLRYPANLPVLQRATAVIVHSPYSLQLARRWYGPQAADDWYCIPLLRHPALASPALRQQARHELGLPADALVACSFGYLGPTKLNQRLIDAWLSSSLALRPDAWLVFVGDLADNEYGRRLRKSIRQSPAAARIRITGWVDDDTYQQYLQAADIGIQLRTCSRGETSAAVLDCLNNGLATLVNANGSMADLPDRVVYCLPDQFTDSELTGALDQLASDDALRERYGRAAAALVHGQHSPAYCAARYHEVIERVASRSSTHASCLADQMASTGQLAGWSDNCLARLATSLDFSLPERPRLPVFYLDITRLVVRGATAAPLTARVLDHWLQNPPRDYQLEPVVASSVPGQYRQAGKYIVERLGLKVQQPPAALLSPRAGDYWLCLEQPDVSAARNGWLAFLRLQGVHVTEVDQPVNAGHQDAWFEALRDQLQPRQDGRPVLWVDISELVCRDVGTGIQRVVRNMLAHWQHNPPGGHQLQLVYADSRQEGYRHARGYQLARLGLPRELLPDGPINPLAGDVFLGLDLQPHVVDRQQKTYARWRKQGVEVCFVVYDLLPLRLPECFRDGAFQTFSRWFEVVSQSDRLLAISRTVAGQLQHRLQGRPGCPAPRIDWFHLGADLDPGVDAGQKTAGQEHLAEPGLARLDLASPTLLMVGTLEPRKAHAQVLDAMELLWHNGQPVNLVIVGRPGWQVEQLQERLRQHPQTGHRLFWLPECSDPLLQWLYDHCSVLLAASIDEGFGLPLIEAARHGLPVLARDIEVFREVAGAHASYFSGTDAQALADSVQGWLACFAAGTHVRSQEMPRQTWQDSAAQLAGLILRKERHCADVTATN